MVFFNTGTIKRWPVSDNPKFDALKPVAPGETYQFIFREAGEWAYYDHLDPSVKGAIIVIRDTTI